MRKFGLTFAVVAALGVGALGAGTAAAPVLAASNTVSSNAGNAGASASALSAKKKAAKRKALHKCGRKHLRKRRKACRRKVSRRFATKPGNKPGAAVEYAAPVAIIDVRDDYFSPNVVNVDSGDSIKWVWNKINHDPHEVRMMSGPEGVDPLDYQTTSAPAESYTWTRRFIVSGTYTFGCTLHFKMLMTVVVS